MGLAAISSNKYTGFTLRIEKLPLPSINGAFSIVIDDINYVKNDWPFNRLSAGNVKNVICFEQNLLKDLETLTVRVAIYFK